MNKLVKTIDCGLYRHKLRGVRHACVIDGRVCHAYIGLDCGVVAVQTTNMDRILYKANKLKIKVR